MTYSQVLAVLAPGGGVQEDLSSQILTLFGRQLLDPQFWDPQSPKIAGKCTDFQNYFGGG